MITKRFDSDWQVKRPFRAVGLTFAALALLFCAATPFVDEMPREPFFLLGLVYSTVLSFFVTGLCLLPRMVRTRVFFTAFVVQTMCFLYTIALLAQANFYHSLSLLQASSHLVLWMIYLFGVVLFAFACYGWFHGLAHRTQSPA